MSIREALPAALHVSEEEPEKEADGLLLILYVCEVPLRAAQLHRPTRHGHPCETIKYVPCLELHILSQLKKIVMAKVTQK